MEEKIDRARAAFATDLKSVLDNLAREDYENFTLEKKLLAEREKTKKLASLLAEKENQLQEVESGVARSDFEKLENAVESSRSNQIDTADEKIEEHATLVPVTEEVEDSDGDCKSDDEVNLLASDGIRYIF